MAERTVKEAIDLAKPWVIELLRRCNIRVWAAEDGTIGLVDVPAKYVAAIDAFHQALVAALAGEDLPAFEPLPPKRVKVRRG